MSKVIADISMSLDGYVTGPGADPDNGLGIGGEGIHGWVLEQPRSPVDEAVLAGSFEATGAVVMGRRLFDVVDGPNGWNDDVGYGHDQDQAAAPMCFVVTHQPPAQVRLASRFQFVTDGVAAAIEQARAAAGHKNVVIMGGANVIDQSLAEQLVDELRIHLSPLLVGEGTRLFDLVGPTTLVQREVVESPRATHLTYTVANHSSDAKAHSPAAVSRSRTQLLPRFDHVGITVADLDAVTAFFVGLGFEVEGRMVMEGEFVDTVTGIPNSRSEIVMLRPPEGGTGLELSTFLRPHHEPGSPAAMANELGLRNVSFEVADLQTAVDKLGVDGYALVGGIGEYENSWRMAYVRGPEGIIVSLAERIG